MIPSIRDTLEGLAAQIRTELVALMRQSKITQRFEDAGGGLVIVTPSPYRWAPLPLEARGLQRRLREWHGEFTDLVDAVLAKQPQSVRDTVAASHDSVLRVVDQDGSTTYKTVEENHEKALGALGLAMSYVAELAASDTGEVLLIPDTNALYAYPALEEWQFEDCPQFCLVLVPAVVSELDKHKDGGHPNRAVVEKAGQLVRQIGEYRRRGRLVDGAALRKERSRVLAWPREPDVTESLPWLKAESADDRLLVHRPISALCYWPSVAACGGAASAGGPPDTPWSSR